MKNQIAVLSEQNQPKVDLPGAPASAPVVKSLEELAGREGLAALLIDATVGMAVANRVRQVRTHPSSLAVTPLFVRGQFEPSIVAAADGVVRDWPEALRRAGEINDLLATLPAADSLDQDEALLRFLYSRPQAVVAPLSAYNHPKLYRYPLLETFARNTEDTHLWLRSLAGRRLLTESRLISRVRACPKCGSAHLNYIDRCPNCHSVDIREKFFLHCFTCGNVAPQEDYHQKGALQCPKCEAQLRHIGTDYDRALENHQCRDCRHVFTEAEVVAACLDCDVFSPPEDLEKVDIQEWVLGEQGRLAVRSGNLHNIYAILDRLNYVTPDYFASTLDWLIRLGRRYKETVFSLLQIEMDNVADLVVATGHTKAALLVESFAERVREFVRTTDLSTRLAENRLLLLLPHTNAEQTEILRGRLAKLGQDTQVNGKRLEYRLSVYSFPKDYLDGETAELIFSRLIETRK